MAHILGIKQYKNFKNSQCFDKMLNNLFNRSRPSIAIFVNPGIKQIKLSDRKEKYNFGLVFVVIPQSIVWFSNDILWIFLCPFRYKWNISYDITKTVLFCLYFLKYTMMCSEFYRYWLNWLMRLNVQLCLISWTAPQSQYNPSLSHPT